LHKIIGAQRLRRITNTLQRSVIKPNALRDRSFAIKTNINLGLNLHSASGGDNNDKRNERKDTRQSTVPKHSAQPTSASARRWSHATRRGPRPKARPSSETLRMLRIQPVKAGTTGTVPAVVVLVVVVVVVVGGTPKLMVRNPAGGGFWFGQNENEFEPAPDAGAV
jgi:hypothetical protein